MRIYVNFEGDDLFDVAESVTRDLGDWAEEQPNIDLESEDDDLIGIQMDVNKREKLKEPLAYLYQLASTYKIECVVGILSDGQREDICYFGHEEGKPDLFEVSTYLGLKR